MQQDQDLNVKRSIWGSNVGYVRLANRFLPAIEDAVQMLSPGSNDRVLDIATGAGHAAVEIRQAGAQVTGIDISPILLSEAEHYTITHNLDAIQFDEGDAADLPYPDRSFTLAISSFGLSHVANGQRAISELARVLVPAGRVTLITWHADSVILKLYDLLRSYLIFEQSDIQLREWGSPNRMRDILNTRVFPVVQSRAADIEMDYEDIESAWLDWRNNFSPFRYAYTRLEQPQRDRVDQEARQIIEAGGLPFTLRYLLTLAQKSDATRALG